MMTKLRNLQHKHHPYRRTTALLYVIVTFVFFILAGGHAVALADTIDIHPSGLAYNSGWETWTGTWDVILDSDDGDTTFCRAKDSSSGQTFYVDMDNPSLEAGTTINSITVYWVARFHMSTCTAKAGFSTDNRSTTKWDVNVTLSSGYTPYTTQTWTTDSAGGPLDLADVNNLQVAVQRTKAGSFYEARVTEVYARIDYTPPATGPTLDWTGDTGFELDGVEPDTAASGASFEFRVKYTDAGGNPPETKEVWVDLDDSGTYEADEKFDMTSMGGSDYTAGVDYTKSLTVYHPGEPSDGALNYRFYFKYGTSEATGEPASDHVFQVTKGDHDPTLDWTGDVGFESDGVDPDSGDSGSNFEFRVEYSDPDDDPPQVKEVWVDLDDSGTYEADEKFDMTSMGGSDYMAGVDYTKSMTVYHPGEPSDGMLNYRFYFTDGLKGATGDPNYDETLALTSSIYYVSTTGSNTEPYQTWSNAATSIQTAIDYASANLGSGETATVIVAGGTYSEVGGETIPIAMKDGVHVINKPGDKPVIVGSGYAEENVSFSGMITCDLRGFEIKDALNDGIHVDGGQTAPGVITNIQDCDIHGNDDAGIALEGIVSAAIAGCTIYSNNRAGIASAYGPTMMSQPLESGSSVTITDCTIGNINNQGNSRAGIYLLGSGSVQVVIGGSSSDANTVWYNGDAGIRLDTITDATVKGNTVNHNTNAGILLVNAGSGSKDAVIQNNTIGGNGKTGINIGGSSYVTIEGNDIGSETAGNLSGIAFNMADVTEDPGGASSGPVTIKDNNICHNSRGGILVKDAIGNTVVITENRIYENSYGGIGIQNSCTLRITKNAIYGNVRGGIHTGTDAADGGGFAGSNGSAHLTIRQNKIYSNGQSGYGAGIDVRHASETISNNLVYRNHRAGIRFGDWISDIINNTVAHNGNAAEARGGGIIYDDLAGAVNDQPNGMLSSSTVIRNNIAAYNEKAGLRVGGQGDACPDNPDCGDGTKCRDYNLLYANNGTGEDDCWWDQAYPNKRCVNMNYGGCGLDANWNKIEPNDIIADPLFKDSGNDDFRLQRISEGDSNDSPAICAGICQSQPCSECTDTSKTDMGAYGGTYPIDW